MTTLFKKFNFSGKLLKKKVNYKIEGVDKKNLQISVVKAFFI